MTNIVQTVPTFPVSVQAALIRAGRVLLLKNERNEWGLPAGQLDPGEQPADRIAREISKEPAWRPRDMGHYSPSASSESS